MSERWIAKRRPDGGCDLVKPEDVSAWTAKHYPEKSKRMTMKFKPVERGCWVWRDGKLIPKHLAPQRSRSGLQVIKDSEPFLNVAVDNGYIGGRRQRRDMMKAHNLIEVGNDPQGRVNRKQHDEFKPREFAEDVKQAARQHGVEWL